jgi:hypothetical protein
MVRRQFYAVSAPVHSATGCRCIQSAEGVEQRQKWQKHTTPAAGLTKQSVSVCMPLKEQALWPPEFQTNQPTIVGFPVVQACTPYSKAHEELRPHFVCILSCAPYACNIKHRPWLCIAGEEG